MAVRDGSFDFLSKLIFNLIDIPDDLYRGIDIRGQAMSSLVKFSDEKTFHLINKILFEFDDVDEIQKRNLVRGFEWWNDKRKLNLLLQILSDTNTSPEYYFAALSSLSRCSRDTARAYIHQNLNTNDFSKRKIILNQLAVEVDNDYWDYKKKKLWEEDSATVLYNSLRVPGTTDEDIAKYHKDTPRADLYWYSDTTTFNYLNSIKYNYNDPLILRIMQTFSTYRKDNLRNYLKSIFNDLSLPDSIKDYSRELYEQYFRNDI